MPEPIRVLIVEDNPADAELVMYQLGRAGFAPEWHRVETASEYLERIEEGPDIILADSSLPAFDGLRALDLLRERGLDIPFLLVSGRIGEDLAVDAMKRGAYDYLLKDRMARLGEAVRSALERKRLRLERAWAAEALAKSEERYRLISEITSDYAYSLLAVPDGQLVCEWITDAFTRVTGFTLEEVNGRGWQNLAHPDDADVLRQHYEKLLSGASATIEVRISGKSGQVRWLRFADRPIRSESGERVIGIYGAAKDITEQKELEFQFRHAQKMEAVGRLAAGLAHDFNNLLTIIIGCGEVLKEGIQEGNPEIENLDLVLDASARAAQLTRQLLAFSRRQILEPRAVNLNTIVTDLEKMLRRILGEDVGLDVTRLSSLGMVRIDPGQMEQVILNLAVNARDAMPSGGRLSIETANLDLDEPSIGRHTTIRAGHYVTLSVTDTGIGMDQETQARIFEPFFTTKEVGKGTGLGLATVYGIVQQSGGEIMVDSEPGRGTTFKLVLPRCQAQQDAAPVAQTAVSRPQPSETILVVEDEGAVLQLVRRTLTRRGYTVLAATEYREALTICQEHPGQIALLLTDVIMPNMTGSQLAEQVKALRPGIKVIFMSGYTGAVIGDQIGDAMMVQKPFTPASLESKIREALDTPIAARQSG